MSIETITNMTKYTKKSEWKHNIDFIKIRKTNISFIWVCSTISEENTQRTKNKSQGKHTDWWTMKSNLEVPLKSNKMSNESTFPVLSKTRFSFHLATWIDDSDYPKFVVIQLFYCCWIVLLYECFDCGEKWFQIFLLQSETRFLRNISDIEIVKHGFH